MTDKGGLRHIVVRHLQDSNPRLPLVDQGEGEVVALLWPGVGSNQRAMHHFVLRAGAKTVPQRHPQSEAVYCVTEGSGTIVDEDLGTSQELAPRRMVFVTPDTRYRFVALEHMVIVGGPCPVDFSLYEGIGAEAAAGS